MAQMVAVIPISVSAAANGSHGPGSGTRDSGTVKIALTEAMTIIGTPTRNAACQWNRSRRNPPSSGPTAAPMPATAAHTARAVARSRVSVNVTRSSDSVDGMTMAAPMPSRTRSAMTKPGEWASNTSTDASAMST